MIIAIVVFFMVLLRAPEWSMFAATPILVIIGCLIQFGPYEKPKDHPK